MSHFDESTADLFTREELAKYLNDTLGELDGFAEAGCSNVVPGGEPCGHCSVCSAGKTIDEIDQETGRRIDLERRVRQAIVCETCAAPQGAPCLDDDGNVIRNHAERRQAFKENA